MVMKALSSVLCPQTSSVFVWTARGCTQTIILEAAMLSYMQQHRQTAPWASEAGGQLFGLIDDNAIRVIRATGPYVSDERSRYHYRSNSASAQCAIEAQAQAGLLYLGEWHSHAEDQPTASSLDKDAMLRLIKNSKLNCNRLLMLIVGRIPSHEGLTIFSVASDKIHQWHCSIPVDQSINQSIS
jgi:integrative and conjugative element protein (TIGR02256 family)